MATKKQVEKLELAEQLKWITKEDLNKALTDYKYCYTLVGEVMMKAQTILTKYQLSGEIAKERDVDYLNMNEKKVFF